MARIGKFVKVSSMAAVIGASAYSGNWLGEKIVEGYFYPNDSLEPFARFAGGCLLPLVVVCMEVVAFEEFRKIRQTQRELRAGKVIDLNDQSMLRRGTPLRFEEDDQDLA